MSALLSSELYHNKTVMTEPGHGSVCQGRNPNKIELLFSLERGRSSFGVEGLVGGRCVRVRAVQGGLRVKVVTGGLKVSFDHLAMQPPLRFGKRSI